MYSVVVGCQYSDRDVHYDFPWFIHHYIPFWVGVDISPILNIFACQKLRVRHSGILDQFEW
jgi:hypothetical protein